MRRLVKPLAIAVWFVLQTWQALFVGFSEDDLMNMYFACVLPLPKLIVANLTPFTTLYRPMGSLFYRVMYSSAGFHPRPFRVVFYALMLVNVWLLYRLILMVSGSVDVATLGTVIGAYHKGLFGFLVNGGTIYDVLCFTFFCLALTVYIRHRGDLRGWRLVGFCALYTAALNSKEMAAGLPAILLIYDAIQGRLSFGRYALWIATAMTIGTFAIRRVSSSFHDNADYALNFSIGQYWSTMRPLVSEVFFLQAETLSVVAVACVLIALWAVAIALRNRTLMLAAAIILLAPLPINFIPYRGFFVMYIPLMGWAMYAGTALALLREWLVKQWPEFEPRWWLAGVVGVLFALEGNKTIFHFFNPDPKQPKIERLRKDIARIHAAIPKDGRALFVSHEFEADSYNPFYIVRLSYGDPTIIVDVAQGPRAPAKIDLRSYDLVLKFDLGKYEKAAVGSR